MRQTAELRRAVAAAAIELDRTDRTARGRADLAAALQARWARMTESERVMRTGLFYGGEVDRLTRPGIGEVPQLDAARDQAAAALAERRAELASAIAAEAPIWADADTVPAVLVPVRLEVRYRSTPIAGGADGVELTIRVIPDDLAVHTFEPALTAAEDAAGRRYWSAVWVTAATDEDRHAAWSTTLADLGAARAAWAVEVLHPAGQPDGSPPVFPAVARRDSAWTQAATSLVLPDRFVFRGWRRGRLVFEVTGTDVPDDLRLGPDPASLGAARPEGDDGPVLAWTGPSAWMVDFAEAERVGMGVRVPLVGPDVSFDELFVVGVSERATAEATARLAESLQGQLYTRGLAFPPPASPTNNTTATRSAWTTAPAMRTPQEVAAAVAAEEAASGQPAVLLADALGLDEGAPGRAGRRDLLVANGGTDRDDEPLVRRAHDLLLTYNTTFASNVISFTSSIDQATGWVTSDAIRQFFVDIVRAAGPLPTVRIGRQPYGFLPVTALSMWAATSPDDVPPPVLARLQVLIAAIGRQLSSSPRVGRGSDQDEVLLDLLRRLPSSVGVRAGTVELRKPDNPGPHPIGGGLATLSWEDDVKFRAYLPPGSPSLLEAPLAGALSFGLGLLEEVEAAAAEWVGGPPELSAEPFAARLLELVGPLEQLDTGEVGLFWQLGAPAAFWLTFLGFSAVVERRTAEVAGNDAVAAERSEIIAAIKELLGLLASFEPDVASDQGTVDQRIGGAVEAMTCRVDAWATAVATARLRTVRATAPTGVRLGAYGWLVDVEPTAPGLRRADAGWVLTPSLHHATTAAVLHSGWAAHIDPEAFAIDLSSQRVRRAWSTLAALRDGRTLEELLGYQLERELHDAKLDAFVAPLRDEFPLPPVAVVDGDEPADADAARVEHGRRLVADGEAVRRRGVALADDAAGPFAGASAAELEVVRAVLAALEETVDAMGDVLLAEGVHQLVGGSPLRAGLAADTVGRGHPVPDRLDVVGTPRRSVSVSHSVGLAVALGDAGGWAPTPRSMLDPVAEAVAAWALGEPDEWAVTITDDDVEAPAGTLADLAVAAIDVVVEVVAPASSSALAARVRRSTGSTGEVVFRRVDGAGDESALAALAAVVRAVLATSRATTTSTGALDPLGSTVAAADLGALAERVSTWWADVVEALTAWAPDAPGDQTEAMLALARLGLTGAGFDAPTDLGAVLRERWISVTLPRQPPPEGNGPLTDAWLARLRADLGEAAGGWVVAAPTWTVEEAGWAALGGVPPTGAAVTDDGVDDWLGDHRDVRTGVTNVLDALAVSGACGAGRRAWIVRQHRPAPDHVVLPDGWVARDHPGLRSASHLAALQVGDASSGRRAVLVVDQWVETLPAPAREPAGIPEEAAALGFRFDRPDARAPHAVLVVAPPDLARGWCLEDVHAAVDETLWWAQARPLDSDDIPELRWAFG